MPIYEYKCKKCKKEFEELVLNSSEKVACPKCGSKNVGRLMSKAAFKVGGNFVGTSSGSSGCSSCSSGNCSSCG